MIVILLNTFLTCWCSQGYPFSADDSTDYSVDPMGPPSGPTASLKSSSLLSSSSSGSMSAKSSSNPLASSQGVGGSAMRRKAQSKGQIKNRQRQLGADGIKKPKLFYEVRVYLKYTVQFLQEFYMYDSHFHTNTSTDWRNASEGLIGCFNS